MLTLAQSYNSGYWRRIDNRSGELRREEFSHCCIHESFDREKSGRTLWYNFRRTITLKLFCERRRTNRKCKRNSEKLFKKVISCFSSVLFLVLSVPDGTLGLKWYRARRAIISSASSIFRQRPFLLSCWPKGWRKEITSWGERSNIGKTFLVEKNHHNFPDVSEKAGRERVWKIDGARHNILVRFCY